MMLRTEAKLLAREPTTTIFALLAPLLILAGISLLPDAAKPNPDLGGLSLMDSFVPTLGVFSVASVGLTILPNQLAGYRAAGVLKRLRTTPVRPSSLIATQLLLNALIALAGITLVTLVGSLTFGVAAPDPILGWVVTVVLTTTSLLALGMLIVALAPNVKAAQSIGTALGIPLMFFGGLWLPQAAMGEGLRAVAEASPVGAAVAALQDVTTGGVFPDARCLLVLAIWSVVATAIAVRAFRWE